MFNRTDLFVLCFISEENIFFSTGACAGRFSLSSRFIAMIFKNKRHNEIFFFFHNNSFINKYTLISQDIFKLQS